MPIPILKLLCYGCGFWNYGTPSLGTSSFCCQ
jgi:hypothetical protein